VELSVRFPSGAPDRSRRFLSHTESLGVAEAVSFRDSFNHRPHCAPRFQSFIRHNSKASKISRPARVCAGLAEDARRRHREEARIHAG
jgi:hypothetical protein